MLMCCHLLTYIVAGVENKPHKYFQEEKFYNWKDVAIIINNTEDL